MNRPEPYSPDADEIDLAALIGSLWEKKWWIISIALLIILPSSLFTLAIVPDYRATAKLQISSPANTRVLTMEDFTTEVGSSYQDYLNSQIQIIRSRSLLEQTVRLHPELLSYPDLNAQVPRWSFRRLFGETLFEAPPEPLSEAQMVSRLRDRVQVEHISRTELVNIHVTGFEPEFTAAAANALANTYIQTNMMRRVTSGSDARDFLSNELLEIQQELERADRALAAFAREHGIADLEDHINAATVALRQKTDQLNRVNTELIQLEAWRGLLNNGRVDQLSSVTESVILRDLGQQLLALRTQDARLRNQFLDGHPELRTVETQMRNLEHEMRRTVETRFDNLSAQQRALRASIEEQEQLILTLNERAVEHNILQRDFTVNQELYSGLLQRMREIGVASGVRENNVALIDSALIPRSAHQPNRSLNLMIGVVLGLMLGGLVALVMIFFDRTLKRPEDVEALTTHPILGAVPLVKTPRSLRAGWQLGQGIRGLLRWPPRWQFQRPMDATEVPSMAMLNTQSNVAESFRSLQTHLRFSVSTGIPQVMLITSSGQGEGKTSAALNLATVLALSGSKVLLLDADLRQPSLHKIFQQPEEPGLSDAITAGWNPDHLLTSPLAGLSILPAGSHSPNPVELLQSERFAALMQDLRSEYDAIILDSAPILGLADALVLSAQADAVLMVVRAGTTTHETFKLSLNRMHQVQAPVVGIVMNGIDPESAYYDQYAYAGS